MCLNRKVLVGLGAVGLAVLAINPGAVGTMLPTLLFLACPLSMMLMMRRMAGGQEAPETNVRTAPAPASSESPDAAEVTRLRAEVDQLRAELRAKPRTADDAAV